jgi:phytoene synthase
VAGFSEVVRRADIRPEYYHSFLDAMAADANPRPYETLDDLIDNYIYGSAIVVGYFLAHIYGSATPGDWNRTMESSRNLGIALQLTNFLRDVAEDQRRGRVYLPQDMLRAEGICELDSMKPAQAEPLKRVLRRLVAIAESYYRRSEEDLDAFAPDCRSAIHACIRVYRKLNERIGTSPQGIAHRESVPMSEKMAALPSSRYWRVPLALLGGI